VNILEQEGIYIPSRENPNGENDYKERRFSLESCCIELNALSQLHEGGNTRTIKCFTGREEYFNLDRLAEKLELPLPQWHIRDID